LIINAKSRSGAAAVETALESLERIGIDAIYRNSESSGGLSRLIEEEAKGVDLVAIAGGDGTLNAAAEGLLAAKLPLAILPTGTANDLARTLGIPENLDKAVAMIADADQKRIDVGSVNDKLFFNVASVGLSAELALELTRDVKRRFGRLGYALAAARVLARAAPFRAEIRSAGYRARVLTLQIAIGNGRFYGGGNIVHKLAQIDDGSLDLYSLEFLKAWRLIVMLRSFRQGEHGAWSEVRAMKADKFEIRTSRARPINADGEIVTQTPAIFHVIPKAIKVLVPKAS
jgi:YegS/Rv2252/BmrU family lipid kinase